MQSPEDLRRFESELIRRVKAFPCLYDRQDPQFKISQAKSQSWREIASQFGDDVSLNKCKKTFAQLLSRFLKVHESVLAGTITVDVAQRSFRNYSAMLYAKAFLQFNDDADQQGHGRFNQLQSNTPNRRPGPPGPFNDYRPQGSAMGSSPQASHSRNNNPGPSGWDPISPPRMPDFSFGLQSPPQFNSQMNNLANNTRPQSMGFQQSQQQPQQPNKRNFNSDARSNGDDRDDSHIDFFFRGISQQVKRAKVNGEQFLDLQATILDLLVRHVPNYSNN